ncbi:MAG: Flp pilus assembly complex ATPase component TadA [Planctomycetes bacterium]|nr:Flp pilus assembly complex ATPase component TadA [Planctomycetota bacterium]
MDETRLGSILLESKVLSEADLERCLEIQALTGGSRPLGQVLVEQGLIDDETLQRLLDLQVQRQRRTEIVAEGDARDRFLRAAITARASELVVSEGRPVQARVGGEWRNLTREPVRGPEVWDFVRDEMGGDVLEILADRRFVSRDYHRPGLCRGRITAFRQFDGVAAILKLQPEAPRSAADLSIPNQVAELARTGKGLVLLAGERGAGSTQALACLLHEAAADRERYVLVIDDNLEYPMPRDGALVIRRRVGEHVQDYVTALRTAVREDPDVIIVGNVGDPEAFDMALRAAEGGRLVIAGLHASGVVTAMQRALNFYPAYDVPRIRTTLAATLRAVLVRQLLPDAMREGVVPATELLLVEDAARDVLRAGDLGNLSMLMRMEDGRCGHCMDRSLLELLTKGRVRFEDVFARAEEKAWVLERSRTMRRMA